MLPQIIYTSSSIIPTTSLITSNTTAISKVKQEYHDAKKHQVVSFVKSGIRILGYLFIPFNIGVAVTLLVVSEAIGIVEELV